MSFVQLATTYQEQNILLCETSSQIYFKCCKIIGQKVELRVGYSKAYADKYHLTQLFPEKVDAIEYPCKRCGRRLVNEEMLELHLEECTIINLKVQPVPRTTPTKSGDTISPNKSKDRLNTGAIRMRKLALSQKSKSSGPTVRYACCYCPKVFSKFVSYKKHTHVIHAVNIEHKRVKVDPQHKRLTIEDSITKKDTIKEFEKENADMKQWFVCQICQRHFLTSDMLEVRIV